jgi:hypothetical protein
MVLFGDLLNLPIPVFPQAFAELFPAGWSQKQTLRVTAAVMALAALAVFLATRGAARRESAGAAPAAIDVAEHSGSI